MDQYRILVKSPISANGAVSVGAYTPRGGGGLTVGENPNGTSFASFRLGAGLGGGGEFEPGATSPGYDDAPHSAFAQGTYSALGGFGEIGFTLFNVVSLGISANAGVRWDDYGNVGPYFSLDPRLGGVLDGPSRVGAKAQGAVGLEYTNVYRDPSLMAKP
jgi:hypothetical protein